MASTESSSRRGNLLAKLRTMKLIRDGGESTGRESVRRLVGPILLALPLALLPYGRSAEIGVLLGLILLAIGLWSGRTDRLPRLWGWLAGLPLLAAWVSVSAALDPAASAETALAYSRFWLAGLGVLMYIHGRHSEQAGVMVTAILAWWSFETLFQALFGVNLIGAPPAADRYGGPFGSEPRLGPVYVALWPIALVTLAAWGRYWLAGGVVIGVVVLVLAGARAAWLSAAIVALVWCWPQLRAQPLRTSALLAACGALLVGIIALAAMQSVAVAERVERSLRALDGDYAALDSALAYRLSIWQPVPAIVEAAPLTGVGVRAFRKAFPQYADANNRWMQAGEAAEPVLHPHQWLVEVQTETGVVGLALWLVAVGSAIGAWRAAAPAQRARAWPYALGLVALLFPLNTHNALYASFTGLYLWWLVLMYVAALQDGAGDSTARAQP